MWGQVSMQMALRAFLRGRTVKVVDLSADVILPLSEVLERFQQGVVMYMDGDAVEEAVEEDPKQLMKENTELRDRLKKLTDEYGNLSTQYAELNAAYQVAQHPAPAPDPVREVITTAPMSASITAEIPAEEVKEVEKPKPKFHNKTVEEVEAEWNSRKITDIEGLRSLRAAGWNVKKLAEEFRCSEQTVRNTMKKAGIA